MLPFWISGAGIIASIAGYFAVGAKDGASQKELMFALHKGTIVSSVLVTGFSAIICWALFEGREKLGWMIFCCIVIGLVAGVLIGQVTEYFTSYSYWPVQSITAAGVTGPATVIIQGLGVGMISTVLIVLVIVATILGCNALAAEYGIAMAAVGMLSTLGVTLATVQLPTMLVELPKWPNSTSRCVIPLMPWTPWEIPLPPRERDSPLDRPS
jgi:K(+)-stimulated pyrophosphate-energized sodium pump